MCLPDTFDNVLVFQALLRTFYNEINLAKRHLFVQSEQSKHQNDAGNLVRS